MLKRVKEVGRPMLWVVLLPLCRSLHRVRRVRRTRILFRLLFRVLRRRRLPFGLPRRVKKRVVIGKRRFVGMLRLRRRLGLLLVLVGRVIIGCRKLVMLVRRRLLISVLRLPLRYRLSLLQKRSRYVVVHRCRYRRR